MSDPHAGADGGDFFARPAGQNPSPYGPPLGYGPPVAPQQQFGWQAPAPGGPPRHGGAAATSHGVPETVAISCTLLAVFGVIGIFVALAVASIQSDLSDFSGDSSSGSGSTEFFFGGGGVLALVLVHFVRAGKQAARAAAALLSGAWGVYWLYELTRSSGGGSIIDSGLGATGVVVTLAGLTLVAACALIGALLWTPSARQHFETI